MCYNIGAKSVLRGHETQSGGNEVKEQDILDQIKYYKVLRREARDKLDTILDSMESIRELSRDIDSYGVVIERLKKMKEKT